MARKPKPAQVNLSKGQVTINVYPFGGPNPIPGWIQDGDLDTVAGGLARGTRIVVVMLADPAQSMADYNAAIACLRKAKYSNVWIQDGDGGLRQAYAL